MADTPTAAGRLDSWKDIASYLKRDVRTAIRWEQARGLPVHRVPGGRRQAVFAYSHELDAWLMREETDPPEGLNPVSSPDLRFAPGFPTSRRADELPAGSNTSPVSAEDEWEHAALQKNEPWVPFPVDAQLATAVGGPQGGSAEASAAPFPDRSMPSWFKYGIVVAAGTAALSLWLAAARTGEPRPPFRITGEAQLTRDGMTKVGPVRTDGVRVYFTEIIDGKYTLAETPASGGPTHLIPTSLPDVLLQDVSPDGAQLLVRSPGHGPGAGLFLVSTNGGTPQPLGIGTTGSAFWGPDGKNVYYSQGADIWTMPINGMSARKALSTEGIPLLQGWAPDEAKLLYTFGRPGQEVQTLWELDSTGSAHQFPGLMDFRDLVGLSWLPGDYLLISGRYGGRPGELFAIAHHPKLFANSSQTLSRPAAIAAGLGPIAVSRDGKRLYSYTPAGTTGELLRFDGGSHQFTPFLPALFGWQTEWSPDAKRMSYVRTDLTLWKASADGSAPQQLVFSPMQTMMPRWSPDGATIAFSARMPNQLWRVYLIQSAGGTPERLTTIEQAVSEGAPTWSPDGQAIIFGDTDCVLPKNCSIHRVELKTRTVTTLPGSEGLRTARWSPDGRYVAALRQETAEMLLFDFATLKWSSLAQPITGDDLAWSRNGEYVYGYNRYANYPEILRVHLRDRRKERVASLASLTLATSEVGNWMGLDPEDTPLFYHSIPSSEVFAFNLEAR